MMNMPGAAAGGAMETQMEISNRFTARSPVVWTKEDVTRFYDELFTELKAGGLDEDNARFLAVQFSPSPMP